jgi:hypothetical protein
MSLIKLLSLGQSFGGVKDEPSPYRLKQGSLPRFTAPPRARPAIRKRDETGRVQRMLFDDTPAVAGQSPAATGSGASVPAGASAGAPELIPAAAVSVAAGTVRSPLGGVKSSRRVEANATSAKGAGGTAAMAQQPLSPTTSLSALGSEAVQPTGANAVRQSWWRALLRRREHRRKTVPTQAEMKLDLVRVARNDLSDADWDLVPQRTASGGAGEWATGLWRRLAGKMTGAARARV